MGIEGLGPSQHQKVQNSPTPPKTSTPVKNLETARLKDEVDTKGAVSKVFSESATRVADGFHTRASHTTGRLLTKGLVLLGLGVSVRAAGGVPQTMPTELGKQTKLQDWLPDAPKAHFPPNANGAPPYARHDGTRTEVSGFVFRDSNGDGLKSHDEEGVPGVKVFVDRNANATLDPDELSAETDADGKYVLGGLRPGTHQISADLDGAQSKDLSYRRLDGPGRPFPASRLPEAQTVPRSQRTHVNGLDLSMFTDPKSGQALTGSGIRVISVDSAVDDEHPAFTASDLRNRPNSMAPIATKHGTYVAGVIAGRFDAMLAQTGTAFGSEIIAYDKFDHAQKSIRPMAEVLDGVLNLISDTPQKPTIINLSMGALPGKIDDDLEGALNGEIGKRLAQSDAIVVTASGNLDPTDSDPNNSPDGDILNRIPSAIVVASAEKDEIFRSAFYSESSVTVADKTPRKAVPEPFSDDWAVVRGTSFASPNIAGVVALAIEYGIRNYDVALNPIEIKSLLHMSGDKHQFVSRSGIESQQESGEFRKINTQVLKDGIDALMTGRVIVTETQPDNPSTVVNFVLPPKDAAQKDEL